MVCISRLNVGLRHDYAIVCNLFIVYRRHDPKINMPYSLGSMMPPYLLPAAVQPLMREPVVENTFNTIVV